MQNMKMEYEPKSKKLTITIDLTKDLGPSKSGKTKLIATTAGAVSVPGNEAVKVGLNVYTSL